MKGGEVLFVGVGGTALARGEARLLRALAPAGVVLVQRNVGDAAQLAALVAAIRAAAPGSILCVDAEGGRVDRLRGAVAPAPAAGTLADAAPRFARRAGSWIGAELRAFGFDLDLAPVVDLDRGHTDNALDGRCYGATPGAVTARARAFLRGVRGAGVGTCLKHFPGLGDATADTHRAASRIGLPSRALARDLAPFAALAKETDAVMLGHAAYPAWDDEALPATVSPAIATGLLRRRVGFGGAALSDDLEMGGLAAIGDLAERCLAALAAGCDGLLVCKRLEETPEIARRLAAPARRRDLARGARRLARLRERLFRARRAVRRSPPALAEIRDGLLRLAEDLTRIRES